MGVVLAACCAVALQAEAQEAPRPVKQRAGNPALPDKKPEIIVRVRDAQTNLPVSDLDVYVSVRNDAKEEFRSRRLVGVTNTQGELRFYADTSFIAMSIDDTKARDKNINAAPGYTFYKTFDLARSPERTWEIKTYTNTFAKIAAVFHGMVTGEDRRPAKGVRVWLLRDDLKQETKTGADGTFAFTTTRLRPHEERGAIIIAEKGDRRAVYYPTPDETRDSIFVRLRKSPKSAVTGQIVDADGVPQKNVPIRYFETFPLSSAQVFPQAKSGGVSDASGRFMVRGLLSEADYRFEFGRATGRQSKDTFWAQTLFPDPSQPTSALYLNPGQTRDIGRVTVHAAKEVIKGRATSLNGDLLPPHLLVLVEGKHTEVFTPLAADGSFVLTRIVREPLTLFVYESRDGITWYTGHAMGYNFYLPSLYQGRVQAGDTNVQITLPAKKQP